MIRLVILQSKSGDIGETKRILFSSLQGSFPLKITFCYNKHLAGHTLTVCNCATWLHCSPFRGSWPQFSCTKKWKIGSKFNKILKSPFTIYIYSSVLNSRHSSQLTQVPHSSSSMRNSFLLKYLIEHFLQKIYPPFFRHDFLIFISLYYQNTPQSRAALPGKSQ